MKTVDSVDIGRFMGDWFVLAGRFTPFERRVHNGIEKYTWNQDKQRIDVSFTYNYGSFDGPQKSVPQKAWIFNQATKAHWKVSPLWPLKFDFLIVALDPDYRWTVIGVPNQKYLWIMARDWRAAEATIANAVVQLTQIGYNSRDLIRVLIDESNRPLTMG